MTDRDQQTQAAIKALAHRLRINRDEDPEVFALEFMTALRGYGWRPTEAKAVAVVRHLTSDRAEPPADLLRELHADLDAKAAAFLESEGGVA